MSQSKLQPDFPAAHSMDTTWFAVDRHGHLGVFESGEDGAVPNAFSYDHGVESEDFYRAISGIKFDFFVDDLIEEAAKNPERPIQSMDWQTQKFKALKQLGENTYDCLLLFDELPDNSDVISLPHSKYKLGYLESIESPILNEWFKQKILKNIWVGSEWTNFRAGLYRFQNDSYGGYPYVLDRSPEAKLKLNQLPETMQEHFSAITFEEFDFSEVRAIQPMEHMKCTIWGSTWMDMNGSQHEQD